MSQINHSDVKELKFQNLNQKHGCQYFLEITNAPADRVLHSELVAKKFVIKSDGKESFAARALHMIRYESWETTPVLFRLVAWGSETPPTDGLKSGQLAVYVFEKTN